MLESWLVKDTDEASRAHSMGGFQLGTVSRGDEARMVHPSDTQAPFVYPEIGVLLEGCPVRVMRTLDFANTFALLL